MFSSLREESLGRNRRVLVRSSLCNLWSGLRSHGWEGCLLVRVGLAGIGWRVLWSDASAGRQIIVQLLSSRTMSDFLSTCRYLRDDNAGPLHVWMTVAWARCCVCCFTGKDSLDDGCVLPEWMEVPSL